MSGSRPTFIRADAMLFSELFQKGRFAVPWHQRYYDWAVSDIQALLSDIDEAIKEDRPCHFLGAVLLVEIEKGRWEINDGQQRMVTVSLLCAALCRRFTQETGDSQREGLALRMLFNLDDSGVWSSARAEHYEPRIEPPVSDRMRYRQMIRGNSIGTNGKLTAAWRTIEDFLGPTNIGGRWESYFDFLRERLEVACLSVPRDIDPNAVYETINSRGKPLDDLDRIRNFIYSHFNADAEVQRKDSVHEDLEAIRVMFPLARKAGDYMRCRLQCRYGFLRKDNFYRDVRVAVREQRDRSDAQPLSPSDYTFELARELGRREDLELFRRLTSSTPDPDFLRDFEAASGTVNSPRNLTAFLRELRGYTVTQPLVFGLVVKYSRETEVGRRRQTAKAVHRSLSRLATFVLRTAFVAPKFEPSHFETEFSNFAKSLRAAVEVPEDGFQRFLQDCDRSEHGVLNDAKFIETMAETTLRGNPRIKHFLLGINRHGRPDAGVLREADCGVEHILPVSSSHWKGWRGFENVDPHEWVHKIGNLTLMSSRDNKPGSKYNASFATKRQSYGQSSVAVTRELSACEEWTVENLQRRQREFAEMAARVWVFERDGNPVKGSAQSGGFG